MPGMTREEKQLRQQTRKRGPDGLVHVWYDHDPEYLEQETVCEFIDNQVRWPRQLMKDTDEHPTCIRCVARWS